MHVILCHAVPCYAMCAMLCHAMLCPACTGLVASDMHHKHLVFCEKRKHDYAYCISSSCCVMQVFTIKQAAQVLASFSAEFSVREPLWNYIAQQHGFPTQQELIKNAPFGLTQCEWTRAWQYTESCSPYLPVQTGYVPITKLQSPGSSLPLLY